MQINITQEKSLFWLRIYENENNCLALVTSPKIKHLIDYTFPGLDQLSPRGWTSTGNGVANLRIAEDNVDRAFTDRLVKWAREANTHIWLSQSPSIDEGLANELDYCIAADWNYNFATDSRTPLGEAEYQLKYYLNSLSEELKSQYAETLTRAVIDCFKFLPIDQNKELMITTLPAVIADQSQPSWLLARIINDALNGQFLTAALTGETPANRLPFQQKTVMINEFNNDTVQLSDSVQGKSIVIVDDLCQSSASLWAYAGYLKQQKAAQVMGLVYTLHNHE